MRYDMVRMKQKAITVLQEPHPAQLTSSGPLTTTTGFLQKPPQNGPQ